MKGIVSPFEEYRKMEYSQKPKAEAIVSYVMRMAHRAVLDFNEASWNNLAAQAGQHKISAETRQMVLELLRRKF